jgi:hypothetical protein
MVHGFDLAIGANTRAKHRPKRSIGEVLIPSKRLIRDFVHRGDA